MFTFANTGKPCGIILDGKMDGEIIYYSNDSKTTYNYNSESDDDDRSEEKERREDRKKKKRKQKLSDKLKPKDKQKSFNYLKLEYPGHFFPIPRSDRRPTGYVAASQGAGKSTFVSVYVKYYQALHPDHHFYLFSGLDHDDVLDKRNPERVLLDKSFTDAPIDPQCVENSIVCFDDVDSIPNKKLKEAVYDCRKNLLNIGRHKNVGVICTNHTLLNNAETKNMLSESDFVVIFPGSGSKTQPKNFLTNYFGVSAKLTHYILKSQSRWVFCWKVFPNYVMTENELYSVPHMEEKLGGTFKPRSSKKEI
jgi:hypothetical protein